MPNTQLDWAQARAQIHQRTTSGMLRRALVCWPRSKRFIVDDDLVVYSLVTLLSSVHLPEALEVAQNVQVEKTLVQKVFDALGSNQKRMTF